MTAEGESVRLVANAGLATGDSVSLHQGAVRRGSVLSLSQIPDGTLVSNVEVKPFDGGRLVRAAGTSALVVAHAGKDVTVQLPSGIFKLFLETLPGPSRTVAGGGRLERPVIKAGKKVLMYRTLSKPAFKVRGIAMNPVNHPFGGGSHQHVGRPSTVKSGSWPGQKVGRFSRSQRRKRTGRGGR